MNNKLRFFILAAFFTGWVLDAFSLFDVGRFSVTLLLLASCALAVSGFRLTPLVFCVCACLFFSAFLAFSISVLKYEELEKPFTYMIQSILAIGVMFGTASINWDREFPRLRKLILFIAVIVLAYGLYQFEARRHGLPFDFLKMTNQQYDIKAFGGLQRGFESPFLGGEFVTRVSSFFAEPSDLGRFMLWVLAFALACRPSRLRFLLMTVGVAGVVLSQSMGGLVGLAFLVCMVLLLKRDLRGLFVALVLCGFALGAFYYFSPEEAGKLQGRAELIVQGRQAYLEETGRFAYIMDHIQVFMESPLFGHGLAAFAKVAPGTVVVNAVMLLLIDRGIVGSLLFLGPFFWVFFLLWRSMDRQDETARTALFILIVEIYVFSTHATLYFSPVFFALGFAVSRVARHHSHTPFEATQARTRTLLEGPQNVC